MNIFYYLTIVQFFLMQGAFAQDFHLAQYESNPLNLNPALNGERLSENKGVHYNFNYRDQIANYSNAPGSFKSFAAGIDIPINAKFSIGQYYGNNKSVDGVFNSNNFMFSTAYKINHADGRDRENLSVGLQLGVLNTAFNPQNFTYGSQYSASAADGFDRNISSGENLTVLSVYKFNVNFGVYYRRKLLNDKLTVYGGGSVYNISNPSKEINGVQLPMALKYNVNIGAIYKADEKLTLKPQILIMAQNKANELNVGVLLYYKLTHDYETIFGVGVRNKNAIIFNFGLRVKENTFRASYCAVNSYLYEYKNKGLEFSVIHTAKKKIKKVISEI